MDGNLPRLIVRDASGTERLVEIARTPFTMGRQSENDLVLLDSRISRRHAKIIAEAAGYFIEDTGSRHGTFVNGDRVTSHLLKSGDQISLGVSDAYNLTFFTEQAVLPGLLEKIGKAAEGPAPQLQHLSLLLQMAQMLHRAPALEEVLTTLLDSALQLTDAERGLLFLRDQEGGELRLHLARGRGNVYMSTEVIDYSHGVVERVAASGKEEVLLEEELTGRMAQETALVQGGVSGIVALPLQKLPMIDASGDTIQQRRPEMLGVLYLDSKSRATSLTGLDRQVLQSLAVEGATVIENARLFRRIREQERIQHELSVARRIQETLLPHRLPESDYYELEAFTMPCQTVGGDYYDMIRLPEERLGIAVADVSGKGVPAALLAATLQGAFGSVAASDPTLQELFRAVNEFMCERTPIEMFATVFYGVLDRKGRFNFVNAGHAAPLVVRTKGVIDRLDSSNFPLGFFANIQFTVDSVQLQPGDQILIFSDGVTEAQNRDNELFGETRLKAFLESCAGQPAKGACSRVVSVVRDFVGSAPQADDLTLTVLCYQPS